MLNTALDLNHSWTLRKQQKTNWSRVPHPFKLLEGVGRPKIISFSSFAWKVGWTCEQVWFRKDQRVLFFTGQTKFLNYYPWMNESAYFQRLQRRWKIANSKKKSNWLMFFFQQNIWIPWKMWKSFSIENEGSNID